MATGLSFWSQEARVLGFEPCSGAGAREQRRWLLLWRVSSLMEFFPPYKDRLEDDLSVGGGLGPSRFLERQFRRKWWLGCSWWRVGSQADHTKGA